MLSHPVAPFGKDVPYAATHRVWRRRPSMDCYDLLTCKCHAKKWDMQGKGEDRRLKCLFNLVQILTDGYFVGTKMWRFGIQINRALWPSSSTWGSTERLWKEGSPCLYESFHASLVYWHG